MKELLQLRERLAQAEARREAMDDRVEEEIARREEAEEHARELERIARLEAQAREEAEARAVELEQQLDLAIDVLKDRAHEIEEEAARQAAPRRTRSGTKIERATAFVLGHRPGQRVSSAKLVAAYHGPGYRIAPGDVANEASTISKDMNRRWSKRGEPYKLEFGVLVLNEPRD